MTLRTDRPAPYAPAATILAVINGFRDRGLATPFTPEVLLRAGVTDSLVPRTLNSLQVLDLIDEGGNPTAQLEGLRRAKTDEFKVRLEEVVRSVYAEVFQFTDPAKDDANRVTDAFRVYEPSGQRGRMVSLFMGLCEAAGILPEGLPRKPTSTGAGRKSLAKPIIAKRSSDSVKGGEYATLVVAGVDPLIVAALQKLPPNKKGWTQEERTKWLTFFTTTLDFTVPIRAPGSAAGTDDVDDNDSE